MGLLFQCNCQVGSTCDCVLLYVHSILDQSVIEVDNSATSIGAHVLPAFTCVDCGTRYRRTCMYTCVELYKHKYIYPHLPCIPMATACVAKGRDLVYLNLVVYVAAVLLCITTCQQE